MENHADLLVIFGITGDLARRMTFRALYRLERRGLLDGPIIGVASDDITTGELVKHSREAIGDSGQDVDDAVTEVRLLLRRTPRLAFLPQPTRAESNQVVLRIDPDPGLRLQLSALTDNPGAPSTWTPLSSASWANPRNRTSGCCTPRWPATISSSPGRTASRRPGASCSRCSAIRPPPAPTRADPGDPTAPRPWSAVTRAGSRRGCPPAAEPMRRRGS